MKRYILAVLFIGLMFACHYDEVEVYDAGRLIFISDSAGIDTTKTSFKHHLGEDSYSVPFHVHMIGEKSDTDLEYRLEVIDSLTTALPAEYELPQPALLRKERFRDTLWIKLKKTDRLATETVRLVVQLAENQNFRLGYTDKLTASVTFNDQMSRPEWWNNDIIQNFLGAYSDEKYLAFYECTGLDDLKGYAAWEIRQFTLIFKKYIEDHNLTEKDGSPMTVVAY